MTALPYSKKPLGGAARVKRHACGCHTVWNVMSRSSVALSRCDVHSREDLTATERQILAADKAARLRVAERLFEWADKAVMAGIRHRSDAAKRARYGAQARALIAAANEITAHDRDSSAPDGPPYVHTLGASAGPHLTVEVREPEPDRCVICDAARAVPSVLCLRHGGGS